MYSYIIGEFVEMTPEGIVIENNGIGYDIKTSSLTAENIPKSGEFVKVYTYLHVREDDMSLYGFLTRDELNVFKLLINVNGIGPKGALGILSAISTDDLRFAVLSDDVNLIKSCPGVGAKTAQRLIIELKDKLKVEEAFEMALNNRNKANAAAEQDNSIIVLMMLLRHLYHLAIAVRMRLRLSRRLMILIRRIQRQYLRRLLKALQLYR